MKQPEFLTKEQLKQELIAHGVELPSASALKSVYIELYNLHINKKTSKKSNLPVVSEAALEKQSEASVVEIKTEKDEVQGVIASARRRKTKRDNENDKVKAMEIHCVLKVESLENEEKNTQNEMEVEDVGELSNAEIAARLRNLGQSVGPITANTRNVYVKKLKKLLESGDAADKEEEPVDSPPVTRSASKKRSVVPAPMQPVVTIEKSQNNIHSQHNNATVPDDVVEEEKQVPEATENATVTDGPAPEKVEETKARNPKRKWNLIGRQIAFTILVVLFAYFVYQALERNPLPLSLPEGGRKN